MKSLHAKRVVSQTPFKTYTEVYAKRRGRSPRYGSLDDRPPPRNLIVAALPAKDLTREGVEPNPGPGKEDTKRDSKTRRHSSSSSSSGSGHQQTRKVWRAKEGKQNSQDLMSQLSDLSGRLNAIKDVDTKRVFEKREVRDDKRWEWEKRSQRHQQKLRKREIKKLDADLAHTAKLNEHELWEKEQERSAEEREAENTRIDEAKLQALYEAKLDVIFDTLRGTTVCYWWKVKSAVKGGRLVGYLALALLLCSFLTTVAVLSAEAWAYGLAAVSCIAAGCVAARAIYWLLYEMGGDRFHYSFVPDAGAMVEWDLRPDAQGIGDNKHTNPLYTQGLEAKRSPGLLGKRYVRQVLISLELLAQLLNPNVMDIGADYAEKHGRIARIAKTCHSINLNRFHGVIEKNVVEDTAFFALAAVMSRERRIKHSPFRIPLNRAAAAAAPTWRV